MAKCQLYCGLMTLKASYTHRACTLLPLSCVAVPSVDSTTSESSETDGGFKYYPEGCLGASWRTVACLITFPFRTAFLISGCSAVQVQTTGHPSHNNPCLEGVVKVTNLVFIHEYGTETNHFECSFCNGENLGF